MWPCPNSARRFPVPILQLQCVFILVLRVRKLAALPPSVPGWYRRCKGFSLPAAALFSSIRSVSKGGFLSSLALLQFFLGTLSEVLEKEPSSGQKSPSCLCSSGFPYSHSSPQAATRILLKILAQFFPQSVTSSKNPTAASPDEQVLLSNRSLVMPTFPSTWS